MLFLKTNIETLGPLISQFKRLTHTYKDDKLRQTNVIETIA
jgi:hypothetical protein